MEITSKELQINKLQQVLKLTFGIVPIAAGADKFLNLLTQWDEYLSPGLAGLLPISASTFMMVVGVVEIVAGILVFTKTRLGAYIVSAWLVLIALSLLFTWHHVDVAVRDLVMAVAAFTLAKLTEISVSQPTNRRYGKLEVQSQNP
ncbi:MAG: hypothetical protein R3A50_04215 [Saprospiraceae bacterium]|nr:hypothetical protein [Saprospiraceae bacterium]